MKAVSVFVLSNKIPYGDIDCVVDSWHGRAEDDYIREIVQKFMKTYKPNNFGFTYDIKIVER